MKKGVQIFFSHRIRGEEVNPHLYPPKLAAANAAVTTKLAENKVPRLGLAPEDEFVQGPWLRQGSLLAWTPSQGSESG